MRAARWFLGAASGLLAATLSAQTLPVPSPLPSPSPEPTTALSGTPGEPPPPAGLPYDQVPRLERARPWEYEASVGMALDSNINFQFPEGPSDLVLVPSARLARVFRSPRGELRAAASGRWMDYADENAFNRGYADFSLDGTYASSTRTRWQGNAAYVFGHSDSSLPLLEQGVLLPLVKTQTLMGTLGVSHQLGRRDSLRIDGRVYRTEFDAPEWVDGASLRGTISLARQFGSRGTAAIVYSVENVRADGPDASYLTHFGSLQYTRVLSAQASILFEGGASYTPDSARAGLAREQNFFGGVSFNRQIKRSSLAAFVRREVTPAFGISLSQLDLRAGLNATIPMGQHWELEANAIHISPDNPGDGVVLYASSDDAGMALTRRLGERLALSARASFLHRGATTSLPSVQSFEAGLVLSVSTPGTARGAGGAGGRRGGRLGVTGGP